MTLLLDRTASPHIKHLDMLIDELAAVLRENGGTLSQREAMRKVARATGVSISEMPYAVNSAVAEKRVSADLRSATLTLIEA